MNVYEPTSEYAAMTETDTAFNADPLNLDKLYASDAAYKVYSTALIAAQKEWLALPEGDAKFSAETNADDTEGCSVDKLKWVRIALATYQAYGW